MNIQKLFKGIGKTGLCSAILLTGLIGLSINQSVNASHKPHYHFFSYSLPSHHNYYRLYNIRHHYYLYRWQLVKNHKHIKHIRKTRVVFHKRVRKQVKHQLHKLSNPTTVQSMTFSDGSTYYWYPHQNFYNYPVWQNIMVRQKNQQGVNLTNSSIPYKSIPHLFDSPQNIPKFERAIRKEIIRDLNKDRKAHRLRPFRVNHSMQTISNIRVRKALYGYENYNDYKNYPHNTSNPSDNWIHGYDTNQSVMHYVRKLHYPIPSYWGENASDFANGYSRFSHEDANKPYPKLNSNSKGIADNVEYGYMDDDLTQGNQDGHRLNILNPHYKYVGVGVYYNKKANFGANVEDFES